MTTASGCRLRKSKLKRIAGCYAALALIASPKSSFAQTPPLNVADTIHAREFGLGSKALFSPDGGLLAYTVIRSHAEDQRLAQRSTVPSFVRGADIYVTDVRSRRQNLVTGGEFDNWSPTWSPNGQFIAFLSDRDGSGRPKVWIWNSRDHSLRKLSDLAAALLPIQWTPDGKKIIFSAAGGTEKPVAHLSGGGAADLALEPKSTVKLYEGSIRSEAAPWSLADYLTSLEVVNVDTGEVRTAAHAQVGSYALSPDGAYLAFTVAKDFEKPATQQILFDLALLDMRSEKLHVALSGIPLDTDGSGFSWAPDSSRLCIRIGGDDRGRFGFAIVTVSGEPRYLKIGHLRPSPNPRETPVWDESGRHVFFLANGELWQGNEVTGEVEQLAQISGRRIVQIISNGDSVLRLRDHMWALVVTHDDQGKQDGIYGIRVRTGESRRIMEQGQCYTCVLDVPAVSTSADGQRVAFVAEDAVHPSDLWIADGEFKSVEQLTRLNLFFDPLLLGKVRLVDWLSDDGERLKGVVLLPAVYQPDVRYPCITYVYGGALLSNRFDRFGLANTGPLNMQLLSTRGYAVFLPDAPLNSGTPMLSLAKTVLPGINKVIELGIADPDKLAVMGHSFGGYSVLSLIVQTTRFKAAVVMAGAGDLFGLYGEMRNDGTAYGVALTEHGQFQIGGTPWDHRAGFIENSPFFYYDRIETPVLIIHGTEDRAVASFLADQTYVTLRRLGKDVEYASYPGEDHSPAQEWSCPNQMDLFARMLAWLDVHLKGIAKP